MSSPPIDILVLDAAPLLSLAPLKGLAKTYVTIPQVLAELRDPRAREHFQKLGTEGLDVLVKSPDVVSYSKVTAAAKKSGDYAVLSQTDMTLLALAVSFHDELGYSRSSSAVTAEGSMPPPAQIPEAADVVRTSEPSPESDATGEPNVGDPELEDASEFEGITDDDSPLVYREIADGDIPDLSSLSLSEQQNSPRPAAPSNDALFEDPPCEDDGEGEWITPDNVAKVKAREIFSMANGKAAAGKHIEVGCMTSDYAMQNVLLHMGLNLVSPEGKRISMVKTWVLRCHACYKLCKDQTKRFCPSCGNPTLIRASVSTRSAPPGSKEPAMVQVHLKSNFQYRNRGSKYSIPAPKPGNAKGSNNLILREDQIEFQRGLKSEAVRVRKEEKRIASALAAGGSGANGSKTWLDPDWMPNMLLGRSSGQGSALPDVGYGKQNPNQVRKKKR